MDGTVRQMRTIAPPRLAPLDALRGLVIVLMALDHANVFIAHGHPPPEMWSGPFPTYHVPLIFITRAITHLAAPGLFMLMGASMVLFARSRLKLGWTPAAIRKHLFIRGIVLILFQLFIENPAWIWGVGGPFTVLNVPILFGVLYGLGGTVILGTLLLNSSPRVLLSLSVALLAGTEIVIRFFAPEPGPFTPLAQLLLLPGTTETINVLYPILPWLGVTTFGMAFGHWFSQDAALAYRRALYVGLAFLVVFVPVRALNGFGNIRAQVGTGWIAFLNNVKYPPSITFLLLALGIDLTLLFILSRRALRVALHPLSPLIVFGTAPFFFYLTHLYLYGFIGRTFFPRGTGIPAMYPYWILGLVILYLPCLLFGRFKAGRAVDSWWRLF